MTRPTYFSNSYQEARVAFLAAAETAGATCQAYVHPTEKTADGSDLSVDTAWLGAEDASVVLLCVSGVHGPEGFCGSAAQIQALTDGSLANLPSDVAVLMVHALNPFGFAYMTRYNENNVDLNRNWVNFNDVPSAPALYEKLHDKLPPVDRFDEALFGDTLGAFAALLQEHGGLAVENALSAGQYGWPTGVGYGGGQLEWSSGVMERILARLNKQVRHIAYLDWHSLIRCGTDDFVYLNFNKPGGQLFGRCRSWWGAENVDPAIVDGKWDAGLGRDGGRPDRNGILMWGVQRCVAPAMDVAGGVVEFTDEAIEPLMQKVENLRAMLLSRYFVHTRDITSERGKKFYWQSRELWCPTDEKWQDKALVQAQGIFQKTVQGAIDWAAENTVVVQE